jgi:exonuclease SbcC
MSDALTHAREQARARTSEAAAYGTVIDTARADTDAADLRADADRLTETARVTAEQAATAQEQARTLDETRQYAEDVQNALIAAEHTRQMTEQAYETAAKDAARTRAAATGADLLADAQAGAADTREARAEAEQIIKSVTDAENTARKLETLAEEASEEAARLTAIADGRTADEQAARARADAFPPDDAPAATALQTRLEDLTGRLGAATGERDRLDRAMTALRLATADGHAECPTCMTVLGDASALLTGMERDRDGLDVTVSDIQAEIAGTRTEIAGLQAEQVERARLVSSVDRAELTAQSACREALTAAGQATRAEEAAETAAETAHDAASAAQAAAGELPGLIDMEREAQAALRRAEAAAEAEAALPAVVQEAQVAEDAFSAAVTVHTSAVQAASLVDVLTARSEAVAARSAALLAVKTAGEAEQAAVLAARDARDAEQAAADAHEQAARRKRALADAETALAVSAALEEFRRDRIARLAPELSEVASDVVSTMTEGRYSTVELDEDFTPVLTEAASGLQRPTAWLSGGEESAVALALRIAIGEVVSGQRAGLLVLDEVLTAQDPARRAAVMSAIRALNARQVITINHVSEASDMVDLVAYVVPDPEGGSTLELAAGDSTEAGLVSEEMLDA